MQEAENLKRENAQLREVIEELILNLDGVCGESLATKRRAVELYRRVRSCTEASVPS